MKKIQKNIFRKHLRLYTYFYIISFILLACNMANKKYAKGFISYALRDYENYDGINDKYTEIPYEFRTGDKIVFHLKEDLLDNGLKGRIKGEIIEIDGEKVKLKILFNRAKKYKKIYKKKSEYLINTDDIIISSLVESTSQEENRRSLNYGDLRTGFEISFYNENQNCYLQGNITDIDKKNEKIKICYNNKNKEEYFNLKGLHICYIKEVYNKINNENSDSDSEFNDDIIYDNSQINENNQTEEIEDEKSKYNIYKEDHKINMDLLQKWKTNKYKFIDDNFRIKTPFDKTKFVDINIQKPEKFVENVIEAISNGYMPLDLIYYYLEEYFSINNSLWNNRDFKYRSLNYGFRDHIQMNLILFLKAMWKHLNDNLNNKNKFFSINSEEIGFEYAQMMIQKIYDKMDSNIRYSLLRSLYGKNGKILEGFVNLPFLEIYHEDLVKELFVENEPINLKLELEKVGYEETEYEYLSNNIKQKRKLKITKAKIFNKKIEKFDSNKGNILIILPKKDHSKAFYDSFNITNSNDGASINMIGMHMKNNIHYIQISSFNELKGIIEAQKNNFKIKYDSIFLCMHGSHNSMTINDKEEITLGGIEELKKCLEMVSYSSTNETKKTYYYFLSCETAKMNDKLKTNISIHFASYLNKDEKLFSFNDSLSGAYFFQNNNNKYILNPTLINYAQLFIFENDNLQNKNKNIKIKIKCPSNNEQIVILDSHRKIVSISKKNKFDL